MPVTIILVAVLAFTEPRSKAEPIGADVLSGNL